MKTLMILLAGFLTLAFLSCSGGNTETMAEGPDNGATATLQKATFAGGCFWCMEKPFEELNGVAKVTSGCCYDHGWGQR